MKILFICSTELQLFNALNLKMHLFPKDSSDIIIQFLKKDTVDFYRRVKDTGLFDNVCYRLPDVFGLHKYARCVRNGDFSKSFVDAAQNSAKDFWRHLSSRTSRVFIDNIRDRVYNINSLDFSAYQAVFAGGSNDIVTNILRYMHNTYPDCKINLYEEGFGTYFDDILGNHCEDIKKEHIYLYDPDIALYQHDGFVQIPKINRNDIQFIAMANRVFDYKAQEQEMANKIIFLDNRVNPMPSYLTKSKYLAKTIFRKPYKRHLREHETYVQQIRAYRTLVSHAKGREIFIKLHPRTERENIKDDYNETFSKILDGISVPWELFCCNCAMSGNIFVTTVSSAMQSNMLVMDEEDTNVFIILCRYAEFDLMADESFNKQYQEFYNRIKLKKNDHQVYLPADEDEYIALLERLL